jgi:hypothetical protein
VWAADLVRRLGGLLAAKADSQAGALLDRDPATHTGLGNPDAVVSLLGSLRASEATGQAAALASRIAAQASAGNPAVAVLLFKLRETGASAQAAELIQRLPAGGMFQPGSGAFEEVRRHTPLLARMACQRAPHTNATCAFTASVWLLGSDVSAAAAVHQMQ